MDTYCVAGQESVCRQVSGVVCHAYAQHVATFNINAIHQRKLFIHYSLTLYKIADKTLLSNVSIIDSRLDCYVFNAKLINRQTNASVFLQNTQQSNRAVTSPIATACEILFLVICATFVCNFVCLTI